MTNIFQVDSPASDWWSERLVRRAELRTFFSSNRAARRKQLADELGFDFLDTTPEQSAEISSHETVALDELISIETVALIRQYGVAVRDVPRHEDYKEEPYPGYVTWLRGLDLVGSELFRESWLGSEGYCQNNDITTLLALAGHVCVAEAKRLRVIDECGADALAALDGVRSPEDVLASLLAHDPQQDQDAHSIRALLDMSIAAQLDFCEKARAPIARLAAPWIAAQDRYQRVVKWLMNHLWAGEVDALVHDSKTGETLSIARKYWGSDFGRAANHEGVAILPAAMLGGWSGEDITGVVLIDRARLNIVLSALGGGVAQ